MGISDYNSLVAGIGNVAHRQNITNFTNYIIAPAQEQLETDIAAQNCGQYLRWQEAVYPPVAIDANGHAPVPSDWLGPKSLIIVGQCGTPELKFKAPGWIYARFPRRTPTDLPRYVARDRASTSGGWPQSSGALAIIATAGQTTFDLSAGPAGIAVLVVALDGAVLTPGRDYALIGTTLTLFVGALVGQTLYVQFAGAGSVAIPQASGTEVLVFGPYPNQAYTVQGTYYAKAAELSPTAPTNWMTDECPNLLLAACMVRVGLFIPDDKLIARWAPLYQSSLNALIMKSKGEVWSAGTLQASPG